MIKSKSLIAIVLLLALVALQVSSVQAAPLQDTLPDGTIKSVTETTDPITLEVGFDVVVTDSNGIDQTVHMTTQEAVDAGLVTDNGDGTFTVNNVIGQVITGGALFDTCDAGEGANPVSAALTAFFCDGSVSVLTPDQSIQSLHDAGFGFGEIAQACFMAEALGTTCGDLLMAKQSHNFDALGLEGVTNWGQLKKYVTRNVIGGKLQNLGSIMSGRATPTTLTTTTTTTTTNTNGHGHGNNGKGGGRGNGGGHGHHP